MQSTTTIITSTYSSPSVSEITTTASPDSCVDHPHCDILMEEFDACNDTEVAMTVCRKSCHMCDVTTTAPLCIDIHQDCQLLSDHLNVCRDEAFARTSCPKTCGVCGNMFFFYKQTLNFLILSTKCNVNIYIHYINIRQVDYGLKTTLFYS